MSKDIHIPAAALEEARRAYELNVRFLDRDPLTAAILAALKAWPGAEEHNFDGWTHAEGLVLPLRTGE